MPVKYHRPALLPAPLTELMGVIVHLFIAHNMPWQAQGITVMHVFLPVRWRMKRIQVNHPDPKRTPNAFRYEGCVAPQHGTALVQSGEFVTVLGWTKRTKGSNPLN